MACENHFAQLAAVICLPTYLLASAMPTLEFQLKNNKQTQHQHIFLVSKARANPIFE